MKRIKFFLLLLKPNGGFHLKILQHEQAVNNSMAIETGESDADDRVCHGFVTNRS